MANIEAPGKLRWYQGISTMQWTVLWVSYVGWLLDAMDANLIFVVLSPALTDLLGGAMANRANVGFYGGLVVAAQLVGWGAGGIALGIVGDYLGRARTLALSILVYSVFTALCAVATNWWMLALFRFFAGWGVGAEWAVGVSLINETWPTRSRAVASGLMMSAFGFGNLLAGLVNLLLGGYGWRWVFVAGIAPAIIIAIVRRIIPESARWEAVAKKRHQVRSRLSAGEQITNGEKELTNFTLSDLFRKPWLRSTVLGTLMAIAATMGAFGVLTWMPSFAGQLARAEHANPVHAASVVMIIQGISIVIGLISFGLLTQVLGRRRAYILGCVCCMISVPLVYLKATSLMTFYILVPLLGLFVNGIFGVFPILFPELFPTRLRSTGTAFCFNIGRVLSSMAPAITGWLIGIFGNIPHAASVTALVYIIGLIAVMFLPETRGKEILD
jgi:MFS family permease